MILMPLMMLKIGKINSLMKTCLNVYACDFELYCQGLLVSSVTNLAIFEELGAPGGHGASSGPQLRLFVISVFGPTMGPSRVFWARMALEKPPLCVCWQA